MFYLILVKLSNRAIFFNYAIGNIQVINGEPTTSNEDNFTT